MRSVVCTVVMLGMLAGCDTCDAAALRAALASAQPGQIVFVGACTIDDDSAPFVVPTGVVLRGLGPHSSTIAGANVLSVSEGARVEDLTIVVRAGFGIHAIAGATVSHVNIDVTGTDAIGVVAESGLSLEHVSARGPFSDASDDPGGFTFGMVLRNASVVSLSAVTLRAFHVGAVAEQSELDWNGGGSTEHRVAALVVHGGRAGLDGIELATVSPDAVGATAHEVVLASDSGASIVTNGVVIDGGIPELIRGSASGIVHLGPGGAGDHTGLTVRSVAGIGMFASGLTFLSVAGESIDRPARIDGVTRAGLIAIENETARLTDIDVSRVEFGGTAELGRSSDGVVLVRTAAQELSIERVRVAGACIGFSLDGIACDEVPPAIGVTCTPSSSCEMGATTPIAFRDGASVGICPFEGSADCVTAVPSTLVFPTQAPQTEDIVLPSWLASL